MYIPFLIFTKTIIKLDYVRLSRNLYIHYVRLSRNLYIHYVRLSRNLYLHYVRLRPTFLNLRQNTENAFEMNVMQKNFRLSISCDQQSVKTQVLVAHC